MCLRDRRGKGGPDGRTDGRTSGQGCASWSASSATTTDRLNFGVARMLTNWANKRARGSPPALPVGTWPRRVAPTRLARLTFIAGDIPRDRCSPRLLLTSETSLFPHGGSSFPLPSLFSRGAADAVGAKRGLILPGSR